MQFPPEYFEIESLAGAFGKPNLPSPLKSSFLQQNFVLDGADRVLLDITFASFLASSAKGAATPPSFELAGPRETIFWDPATTKVAIVTCGGLAPGLNNVIQSIVSVLADRYHVQTVFGVPFGYLGFAHDPETKRFRFGWRRLDPRSVHNLEFEAGSVLGSGRGNSVPKHIVDALALRDINILFAIGGDGTLAGANEIHQEIKRRGLPMAVIGIPKTIDNDVQWVSKSFGFETAVSKAVEALRCAQVEARGAFHGVGLVRLMGRNSGALTATAAAAMNDIDFVLVPEIPIVLEGEHGFLRSLVNRVVDKGYATIAVAEGAGQHLFTDTERSYDASGNLKLKDIGRFLKDSITAEFKRLNVECTLRYIDPTYILRAQATTADDAVFCQNLGQNAVHAAMAGKTGMMIGYAHEQFTHVPLHAVSKGKKHLDTNSPLWLSVLAGTGQAPRWGVQP